MLGDERKLLQRNALDAALASWIDEAIFDQRLGREGDRILGQSWKALRRVVTAHAVGEQKILGSRPRQNTDRSQLGTASKMFITDFSHSSEASTLD